MQRLKLVAFDWDGTLVESMDLAHGAASAIFRHYGLEPLSREVFLSTITSHYLEFYHRHGVPPYVTAEEVSVLWNAYFKEHSHKLVLREDAKGVFETCRMYGVKTVIVSGSPTDLIRGFLQKFGLENLVDRVYGNAVGKTIQLEAAARDFLLRLDQCAYVDDIREGIKAARLAGIRAIGITGGFNAARQLIAGEPHHVISSLSDLTGLLGLDDECCVIFSDDIP